MIEKTGFLKRTQNFRNDEKNERYFPILEALSEIASKHHNTLPTVFYITLLDFPAEDIEFVLKSLYPTSNYTCKQLNDCIFCIR